MVKKRPTEEIYRETLSSELDETRRELSGEDKAEISERDLQSWRVASDLVNSFRPVPWIMWTIIRSAFGRSANPNPEGQFAFASLSPLIYRGIQDSVLSENVYTDEEASKLSLPEAVDSIGHDVASALCFMHAVCRRVSTELSERIWRPLLDDALLRAELGYHIGAQSKKFGKGRGMLAGFSGRCGLAVQIASGDILQAQQTLEALAAGTGIREVGLRVYGCDPLQVSAMALTAGGCSRNAAIGIASYSQQGKGVRARTEQHRWLSAFSIAEQLRMGTGAEIEQKYWSALDFDVDDIDRMKKVAQGLQRQGHSWGWMTDKLLGSDVGDDNVSKTPEEIREAAKGDSDGSASA